jgi:hypothetical protein
LDRQDVSLFCGICPCEADTTPVLELSHAFTDLMLHSIALRPQPKSETIKSDSTQLRALVTALEAGKRFLDTLLSLPVDDYPLVSFSEWIRIPSVIMLVAKICMPSDMHAAVGWDVKAAQDLVRLELSLEVLVYRFKSLSTYHKTKSPHTDFWWAMQFIIDHTRIWYLRKTKPKPQDTFTQFTPSTGSVRTPSTISCPASGSTQTPIDHQFHEQADSFAGEDGGMRVDFNMMPSDGDEPMAFLKNVDFDMEQFFDMGIWGDEAYSSMGFGGGMSF